MCNQLPSVSHTCTGTGRRPSDHGENGVHCFVRLAGTQVRRLRMRNNQLAAIIIALPLRPALLGVKDSAEQCPGDNAILLETANVAERRTGGALAWTHPWTLPVWPCRLGDRRRDPPIIHHRRADALNQLRWSSVGIIILQQPVRSQHADDTFESPPPSRGSQTGHSASLEEAIGQHQGEVGEHLEAALYST
ncbi:hypothetical protein L226DRAFT_169179 [Lentinus tigrinus ALCF2SS1-7]|uniref:uncharacterized protein n=1 Tax=Lentinus tigrinus ALCF2SS1-7 TaxID=1328758 RepID=UPI001165DA83|nr:hypothetical protein L226DRAFT_169179 [Lentinus tigrinus ALCF2SS1-7]